MSEGFLTDMAECFMEKISCQIFQTLGCSQMSNSLVDYAINRIFPKPNIRWIMKTVVAL